MWEVTLIGVKQDYVHFILYEKMIKSTFGEQVVIAISDRIESSILSVAVCNKKLISSIKKTILELIIKICKEEYFLQNLNLETNDEELRYFILMGAVLSNLDDEVDYARVVVKFSKVIHIRSLVRFRLNKIYSLWNKFEKYFNSKFASGLNDVICLDFLKFFANNIRKSGDIVYLDNKNDFIIFKDKNNKSINKIHKSDQIGIVVNLIVISPFRLVINCYSSLNSDILSLIKYLFEDKVSILL